MTDLSLAGADDARPMTQLGQLGVLSAKDRAALRRLSGDLTLGEWMAADPLTRGPWRGVQRRTRLVMAARVKAVQDARLLARLCPSVLIQEVRRAD